MSGLSRRALQTDPWGALTRAAELDSSNDDWAPAVSLDGLTSFWFATDRSGEKARSGKRREPARSDRLSAPSAVPGIAGNDADFAPAVDATETLLFFSSNRTGSAGFDLYESSRSSTQAAWGAPAWIPGLNSASDEYDPFVAQGGLVVFFTSMALWRGRHLLVRPPFDR